MSELQIWLLGVALSLILIAGCKSAPTPASKPVTPEQTAVVFTATPKNFYQVNAEIWRSSQPSRKEFQALCNAGLKSVLNLRNLHCDDKLVAELPLKLYELRLNAGDLSSGELLSALRIVKKAEKPLLVHSWHGSSRVGAVIAGCRILFDGWSVEQAIDEFLDHRFGHHRLGSRYIPQLLRSIDWEEMRRLVNE